MDHLLDRSRAFEATLNSLLENAGNRLIDDSPRHLTYANACLLSNEHAATLRLAFANGAPNSGAALMRLQYKALLRGAWVLYAATDEQIARLDTQLDAEAEALANKLPLAGEMLKAVVERAPTGLSNPLSEFHLVTWKSLNSFVHGGIHPLQRVAEGFPASLAEQIVRSSNGLMHVSYRLLASLSGSNELMMQITDTFRTFHDCLPSVMAPSVPKSN